MPKSKTQSPPLVIALAGNPNAGKTTLFNRLTGGRAKVGNYPGVTVEKITGKFTTSGGRRVHAIDLPGTYSLSARSLEEQIALDVIHGNLDGMEAPQLIIVVVDSSNLERNLYLVEQLREIGAPIVVALNMIDVARQRGISISTDMMSAMLRVPVIPMSARSGEGVDALLDHIDSIVDEPVRPELKTLEDGGVALITERYRRIEAVCAEAVSRPQESVETLSDRADMVLTHRIFGPLFFIGLMAFIFVSIFSWASPLMDLIDSGVGLLSSGVEALLPDGFFRALLTEGIIAGVGNVVIFLPQIAILFIFLAILDDSGYMSRAAFIMDRIMRKMGLSGQSFIPLLGSFACAVPGIMASRTIASRRDRMATIFVAPFMSCSARLPIYVMVTAAFFPRPLTAGLVILSMYLLGIVAAIITAFIVGRLFFKAGPEPFLMELPPYRMPTVRNVWFSVSTRCWDFLKRAGSIILIFTVILWVMMQFPKPPQETIAGYEAQRETLMARQEAGEHVDQELTAVILEENNAYLSHSIAGRLGHLIEPIVKPLGYDWKIGVGIIASFSAREVLVSTLGVIYSVGEDEALEEPLSVADAMKADTWPDGSPIFTPLVGISILVFFVLALQCMSTIAVAKREMGSWKWAALQFGYMTGLAYVAAMVVYQGGRLLGLG